MATIKDWNIRNYHKIASEVKVNWHLITGKEELTYEIIKQIRLQATRAALHKAVDMGLHDDDIRSVT